MSKIIQNPKTYTGSEMEEIFFRPLVSGKSAEELGIRILYNTPAPVTLNYWRRDVNVLRKYVKGWDGSADAERFHKTVELSKVKAEMSYDASDYFGMVYEKIAASPKVNLGDLTGTILEQAETELFREAIAEAIRVTMWLGDTSRADKFNTFDGFLKRIIADIGTGESDIKGVKIDNTTDPEFAEETLKKLWDNASDLLRQQKSQGNLVYIVTSDIYDNYEEGLQNLMLDSSLAAKQNGTPTLLYRGIPVVDAGLSAYLKQVPALPQNFAVLTDRRNLALALNSSDYTGTEIRMWYNPDLMENRQRATFMAGCDYLLPELIVAAFDNKVTIP